MTYVKITDKDGKPIDNSNPLPVVTDIQIGSVTATDVTIKDPVTPTNKLAVNADGSINVQLTGSNMQLYGATVANRPAANSVPVGAYFMAVQTQEIWQSDGTNWVVIRGA